LFDAETLRANEVPAPEPSSFYYLYHGSNALLVPLEAQTLAAVEPGQIGTLVLRGLGKNATTLLLQEVRLMSDNRLICRAPDGLVKLFEASGGDVFRGLAISMKQPTPQPDYGGSKD